MLFVSENMDAGACLCPPRSALYLPPIHPRSRVRGRGVSPSDLAEASIISGLGPLCLDREGRLFEKTLIFVYLIICEE